MKTYHPIIGSAEVCLYRYSTPSISVFNDRLTIGRAFELAKNYPEATVEFRTIHGHPVIIFTSRASIDKKDVCWQHALIDLPAESVETNATALADLFAKTLLEWWPDETPEQAAETEAGE